MKRLKRDFNTNTKVLKEMRSDLNVVFTKIRYVLIVLPFSNFQSHENYASKQISGVSGD